MGTYLFRRAMLMVPVVLAVTVLTFTLIQLLPGGPVVAYLGQEGFDPGVARLKEKQLGLDRPIPVQYFNWVGNVVRGDFGTSLRTNESVLSALGNRVSPTLQLCVTSLFISLLVGIPAGIVAALRRGRRADLVLSTFASLGLAMPSFWLAILAILLFSVHWGVLPTSGYVSLFSDPWAAARHLVLPAFALGLSGAAILMRQTRSSMLEVLGEDFVRTARAKGLAPRSVILSHALRASLLPVVTVLGLQVGRLLGGAVIIEQIFAIPGLGRLAVSSIFGRDFLVVQGFVLLTTLAVLTVNILTDVAYAYLDPRIRLS